MIQLEFNGRSALIRAGERLAFQIDLENFSDIEISKLEIWGTDPSFENLNERNLLFSYSARTQKNRIRDYVSCNHSPSSFFVFGAAQQMLLERQLRRRLTHLCAHLELRVCSTHRPICKRIICKASAGDFERDASATFMLNRMPGLVCTQVENQPRCSIYHVCNDAETPFKIRQYGSSTWYLVRARAWNTKLRLFKIESPNVSGEIQWHAQGSERSDFDGIGTLAEPVNSD